MSRLCKWGWQLYNIADAAYSDEVIKPQLCRKMLYSFFNCSCLRGNIGWCFYPECLLCFSALTHHESIFESKTLNKVQELMNTHELEDLWWISDCELTINASIMKLVCCTVAFLFKQNNSFPCGFHLSSSKSLCHPWHKSRQCLVFLESSAYFWSSESDPECRHAGMLQVFLNHLRPRATNSSTTAFIVDFLLHMMEEDHC